MKLGKTSSIEETADRELPVPFYNWLIVRDGHSKSDGRFNFREL